jgi:hypothetical protein
MGHATKALVQETQSSLRQVSAAHKTATSSALESGVTAVTLLENAAQAQTFVERRYASQEIAPSRKHLWAFLHGGEETQLMEPVVHRITTHAM